MATPDAPTDSSPRRLLDLPFERVDSSWAALLRVALGAGLFLRVAWLILSGYDSYLSFSLLHVPYYGFEWLPVSPALVGVCLYATLATSALLTLGRAPRLMAALSLLLFGYFFLVDRTNFSNLNYILLWLLAWASLMPLGARASLDARRAFASDHTPPRLHMPRWHLWTARAQIGVMYLFSGVVKLSAEWLSGDILLANVQGTSSFEALSSSPAILMFLAYGGALFDILIAPALWWRRTRAPAVLALLSFHGINSVMLDLGLLPLILVLITLAAFTSPERASALMSRHDPAPPTPRELSHTPAHRQVVLALLSLGLAFQLAFPLRHLTYPGDALWHGHGRAGAWWLRSFSLGGSAKFYASGVNPDGERVASQKLDVLSYIHSHQDFFVFHPYTVVAFARVAADDLRARGWTDVSITADLRVRLNQRPATPFVARDLDLSNVPLQRDMTHIVLPPSEPPR